MPRRRKSGALAGHLPLVLDPSTLCHFLLCLWCLLSKVPTESDSG